MQKGTKWCIQYPSGAGKVITKPGGQYHPLLHKAQSGSTRLLAKKEVLRMAAYVLVGGWLGGWCWQRVARRLREEGLDAYPVTLTGLGERVHLASPEVNLATHITDVVNVVEFEEGEDVGRLGHSDGGLVGTGAGDRMP